MEKLAATQGTAGGNCKPLTTFVQTDTHTFREVVQRLTGPSDQTNNTIPSQDHVAPKMMGNAKRSTSKLHERRQYMRPKLEIVKPTFQYFKPADHHQGCLSPPKAPNSGFLPSPVGTPSSIFSKLSILEEENKIGSEASPVLNSQEEEKAIKERRFYLHPSPRGRQGDTAEVPELLTLFPLESPTAPVSNQKA